MNKLFVGIIIIALVGIGGFVLFPGGQDALAPESPNNSDEVMDKKADSTTTGEESVMVKETVIKITKDGFMPNQVTIKTGERIRFQNESGAGSWPASAMHPTHTVYPGSNITKCNTTDEPNIFDACRELADGESWSFAFKEKGAWKYHDHVVNGRYGGITVE
ncbi:MAG: hypothetical protein AAB367_03410 [Patescibacteria group bacterium]